MGALAELPFTEGLRETCVTDESSDEPGETQGRSALMGGRGVRKDFYRKCH